MITGKSLEKVDRICQDLPRSAKICRNLPEVDRSGHHHFFERLFQGLWDFKISSGLRAQGKKKGAGGRGRRAECRI